MAMSKSREMLGFLNGEVLEEEADVQVPGKVRAFPDFS